VFNVRVRGDSIFIAVSLALVAFSAVAAGISIVREGLGADAAAWVQAGGSIAAITGAVWLFRVEVIRRRRERRAFGEENAWAVRFALTNAQLEARTIAAEVVDNDLLKQRNPVRHWLLQTENCRNVLRVYAERTDHIHPALNQIASNGMLLLRQMDEDIEEVGSFIAQGERPSMEIATDIVWYESHFAKLLQVLDERMRGVVLALDENEDSLPVSRMEDWKVRTGENSK
jgi:hypothetical protein